MPMLGSPAPLNPVRTRAAVGPVRAVATGVPTATATAAAAANRTQEERLIPVTSTAAWTSLPRGSVVGPCGQRQDTGPESPPIRPRRRQTDGMTRDVTAAVVRNRAEAELMVGMLHTHSIRAWVSTDD